MKIYFDYDRNAVEYSIKIFEYINNTYKENIIVNFNSGSKYPYPIIAEKMAKMILKDAGSLGILICGTGIGMSIVSNKVPGIYANACRTVAECSYFMEKDKGNLLCIGSNLTSTIEAMRIIDTFLTTKFDTSNQPRIDLINSIFQWESPNEI